MNFRLLARTILIGIPLCSLSAQKISDATAKDYILQHFAPTIGTQLEDTITAILVGWRAESPQQKLEELDPYIAALQQNLEEEPSKTDTIIQEATITHCQGIEVTQLVGMSQFTPAFSERHGTNTCGPLALHNIKLLLQPNSNQEHNISKQLTDIALARNNAQRLTRALAQEAQKVATWTQGAYEWGSSISDGIVNNVEFEVIRSLLHNQQDTTLPRGSDIGYGIIDGDRLLENPALAVQEFDEIGANQPMITQLRKQLEKAYFNAAIVVRYQQHYWTVIIAKDNGIPAIYIMDSVNAHRMQDQGSLQIVERIIQSMHIAQPVS